jgi:hypothetical protein
MRNLTKEKHRGDTLVTQAPPEPTFKVSFEKSTTQDTNHQTHIFI